MNEGRAAAIADAETDEARVAGEARVLRLIAREEAGHAALASDVLRWALTQAPELTSWLRARRADRVTRLGLTSLGDVRARELLHASAAHAASLLAQIVA